MNNIEVFRKQLLNTKTILQEDGPSIAFSILEALLVDYQKLFPPEIHYGDPNKLYALIEKYGCVDRKLCPLCGSHMKKRTSSLGEFKGCSKFPKCKGGRKLDGRAVLNQALKDFLTDKISKERKGLVNKKLSRFDDLEI